MGTCHHIRFWGVTNGIRARLQRSHMYKPSLSRVSRIGTQTSVLIFEWLWRLLGKTSFISFYSYRAGFLLWVLSIACCFLQMPRTRAAGVRGEAVPEVGVEATARGRGRARGPGRGRG